MLPLIGQLLNFALSLLGWLIVGRWVLELLVRGRQNFVTDLFRRGTDPAFALVRRLTPRFIGDRYIPLVTLVLVVVLRIALLPLLLSQE